MPLLSMCFKPFFDNDPNPVTLTQLSGQLRLLTEKFLYFQVLEDWSADSANLNLSNNPTPHQGSRIRWTDASIVSPSITLAGPVTSARGR